MPLPKLNVPESADDPIPADDPLRDKKESYQLLRRQNLNTGKRLELSGVVVPIAQNILPLQVQALMKFAIQNEEDRVDFEMLFQEAISEMFDNVEEQRGRAVLLQPHQPNGRQS